MHLGVGCGVGVGVRRKLLSVLLSLLSAAGVRVCELLSVLSLLSDGSVLAFATMVGAVFVIRIFKKIKYIIDRELVCSCSNDIREKRIYGLHHTCNEVDHETKCPNNCLTFQRNLCRFRPLRKPLRSFTRCTLRRPCRMWQLLQFLINVAGS